MRYDTTKTYHTKEEAEKVAETLRPLRAGDIIKTRGISVCISKVFYSDVFIEYAKEKESYVIYFMCEFRTRTDFRNYKSYFDGGVVELVESTQSSADLAKRICNCLSDGYDDEDSRVSTENELYNELSQIYADSFVKAAFSQLCEKIEHLTE